jgi:hypothetical protein
MLNCRTGSAVFVRFLANATLFRQERISTMSVRQRPFSQITGLG